MKGVIIHGKEMVLKKDAPEQFKEIAQLAKISSFLAIVLPEWWFLKFCLYETINCQKIT